MIRFEPYYQTAVWGGRRFEEEFGRTLPEGPIAESWELAELEERESRVASGPLEGKGIGELWRSGALGGSAKGRFPFLLKWLDAAQRLSVQVHPDGAACERLGTGTPKTEAWYVAQADPKAALLVGHYPGLDSATLRQAAVGGTFQKWLYETRPRAGDMLLLPAGTIHCIGAGFLLLEVQEPSDTTFRLYDWGRVGPDGCPRDLHLEEACSSVCYDRYGPPKLERHSVVGPTFVMQVLRSGTVLPKDALRVLVADPSSVKLETANGAVVLEHGEVAVATPEDGDIKLTTGAAIYLTEP